MIAEDNTAAIDLSVIEAEERQQIIKELSFRLNLKKNCNQTLDWRDSGSGADLDGFFFLPNLEENEYMIGGHASQKRRSKFHCVITVTVPVGNPKQSPAPLLKPKDWQRVWIDKGSGAAKDGAFWQAISPSDDYRCLGHVSQLTHKQKPQLNNYRCVHKLLTNKLTTKSIVWSDIGSGADKPVTVFRLPVTDAYVAVPKRANSTVAYDLKKDGTSTPDNATVDKILAERLAPIKADIAAKAKAREEQRKQEEAKRLAAAKEKKRQAEAAANKKAEAEKLAEEKRLAEKAEEEAMAANVEESKAADKNAKQEQQIVADLAQTKQAETQAAATAEEVEEKTETKNELIADIPEINAPVSVSNETETSNNTEHGGATGLDKLINTFLIILGALFAGLILILVLIKVLFGKKTAKTDA